MYPKTAFRVHVAILWCEMNKFELFTMIFYALDHEWDNNHEQDLGDFLSDMNPFLFKDEGSADPAVYAEFCSVISEQITEENSYDLARKYIDSVGLAAVTEAFSKISRSVWNECLRDYLSSSHSSSLTALAGRL